jgi:hypothetical protein
VQKGKGLIKPVKSGNKWICDLDENTQDAITKLDAEAITLHEDILFIIESYGTLSAADIFKKASAVLTDNLDDVVKAFK